jgi:hypothetical protein
LIRDAFQGKGRIGLLLASLLVGGAPAMGQVQFFEEHVVDTRFGQVQVVGGDVDQQLWFAGEFLPLPIEQLYWLRGAWALAETDHDWVLATSNHYGNMCGGYTSYFIIRASAGGAMVSPPMDACMGILDVRILADRIELDMSPRDPGIEYETFAWDGQTLTNTPVPQAAMQPAGPGEAVTRWIGRDSAQIFEDPAERARFGSAMAPDAIQTLREAVSMGAPVEERDGWIIGRGCQRHLCNVMQGLWAVRIADGAVAAAIISNRAHEHLFGLSDDPVFGGYLNEMSP